MRARRRKTPHAVDSRPSVTKLLLGLALLTALGLAFAGSRMLMAGLYAYQTEVFAAHWHKDHKVPNPSEWERVNTAARSAVNLYPVPNAEYLQLLGENWLWRQYEQPMGSIDPAIMDARTQAVNALAAAVKIRPRWPAHWSALARAQASQLDFSHEFVTSLRNARARGLNRPEVNLQIAELGLLTWPRLEPEARQITQQAIRFSIQSSLPALQVLGQLSQQAGNTEVLCSSLHDVSLERAIGKMHARLCSPRIRPL